MSLRRHVDFTSNSLSIHFDFTSISLRFRFDFTSVPLPFSWISRVSRQVQFVSLSIQTKSKTIADTQEERTSSECHERKGKTWAPPFEIELH